MKKALIFIASLALLVSCAKTVELDEGRKAGSSTELTLRTIANPTKSIVEGTIVPENNIIGLLPNFKKDGGAPYDDKELDVLPFGYDPNTRSWHGVTIQKIRTKGILDELVDNSLTPCPYYWPVGDRISMDYTAFSCSYLSSSTVTALKYYIAKKMSELQSANGPSVMDYIEDLDELEGLVKNYLRVRTFPFNRNRLDVDYEFQLLNLLGMALLEGLDSPILYSEMVGIVLALCAVADVPTGLDDLDNRPISLQDAEDIINALATGSDPDALLERYANLYPNTYAFVSDYVKAEKILNREEPGIKIDPGHTDPVHYSKKNSKENLTQARLEEVVNHAYWLFFRQLPKVSKYVQDDLMFASGSNIKSGSGGSIQATFNHAKAWVKVVVNNQSSSDILVSEIAFKDVNTGGTLIIDNSKSEFEAYWDFSNMYPYKYEPQEPESDEIGISFEPYNTTTLDGVAPASPALYSAPKAGKLQKSKSKPGALSVGLIPDVYMAPSGCYGPALDITRKMNEVEVVDSIPGLTTQEHYLEFKYLSGDQPFNTQVAANLGGAMFPAQEPGIIGLAYYSWDGTETESEGTNKIQKMEMASAVKDLDNAFSKNSLHQVTLNLPRLYWEMGKVYIYVINISDNEITINPVVSPWENYENNPIVAPEETGIVSKDPTEDFGSGDTSGWFAN